MPLRRFFSRHLRPYSAAAAGLAAAALAVSACSAGGSGSGPASAPQSLTFDVASPFYSLDPNVSPTAEDARAMRQIYDSLVAETSSHKIEPWLATSWKISDGGLTYAFQLRHDVKFQDGTPFNAQAACFNFDRIQSPATGSLYAHSLIAAVKSCTVTGTYSFKLQLSQPFGPLLEYLAMPFLGMVSPAAVKKYGAQFAVHPVGTGPFEFSSYVPNSKLVLKRNPAYDWAPASAGHQGPAYLSQLTFNIVPQDSTRVGQVESGGVDGIETVPGQDVAGIKASSQLSFTDVPEEGLADNLFINTQRAPWNNLTAREALRDSMDIGGAVSSLYLGVYTRAWGPLVPGTSNYDPAVQGSWQFSPAEAGKLFSSLGWVMGPDGYRHKAGKTLTVTYLTVTPDRDKRQETATYLQQVMKQSGIKVNIVTNSITGLTSAIESGNYDLADTSFINPSPNIMFSLYDSLFLPKNGFFGTNLGRVNDPVLNKMLSDAQQMPAGQKRTQLYDNIQQYITSHVYSIGVYNPMYTVAMSKSVHGMQYDVEAYPVFYNASVS